MDLDLDLDFGLKTVSNVRCGGISFKLVMFSVCRLSLVTIGAAVGAAIAGQTDLHTQRVRMFSHYKNRFTIKFLIGCAPSGEVTFISRGFGGQTTDTEITTQSGFMDQIEEDDTILADKGFLSIEVSLTEAGGILVMPPFMKGQKHFQFSTMQNEDGCKIDSVHMLVECCTECMK